MIAIYKITNKINNKLYIGQTIQKIRARFNAHNRKAKYKIPNNSSLLSAFNKYGRDNFIIEEIDLCESQEEADYMEKYWIKFFNTRNKKYGYNLAEGGKVNRGFPSAQKGIKLSLEKRKRLSKIMIQYYKDNPDKKTNKKVMCIETGIIYSSRNEAAELLGICRTQISCVCHGKNKTCGGFHWKYVNE